MKEIVLFATIISVSMGAVMLTAAAFKKFAYDFEPKGVLKR